MNAPVALKVPLVHQAQNLIEELNKEFAVVKVGNKVRILQEFTDQETNRTEINLLPQADFLLLQCNRPSLDLDTPSLGRFWLDHPQRREFRRIDFYPGDTPKGVYNLWRGFPVEPGQGDCSLFWEFLKNVICAGDENVYRFVRKWLAHIIQKPTELPGTSLVLRGKQGTGKNTFADTIGKLVEPYFITVANMDQLTGRFNGHLANKLLVHANEAIWGGNKKEEGALKAMVTDASLAVEYKCADIVTMHNFKRVIVSSNEEWAVPLGLDNRRFLVLDVAANHKEDQVYFAVLRAKMEHGGYEALMYDLKHEDLSNFNPRTLPATKAGSDIKRKGADTVTKWLWDFLERGYQGGKYHRYNTASLQLDDTGFDIATEDLYQLYDSYCGTIERERPQSVSQFFRELRKIVSLNDTRPTNKDGNRERRVEFPSLVEARLSFERHINQEGLIEWPQDDD